MKMIDPIELMQYIAKMNWTESKFLHPEPNSHVEIIGLLDKIAKLRGISFMENGKEFNKMLDNINKTDK